MSAPWQTNVVWIAFVAATGAISYVEDLCKKDCVNLIDHKLKIEKKDVPFDRYSSAVAPTLRNRRIIDSIKSSHLTNSRVICSCQFNDSGLMNEIVDLSLKFWHLKWNVLVTFFPYLLVLVAFGAFVVLNGGIVLGAKEAHVVSPHFAQLMYFGLAAAAALAPVHFTLVQASTLWQSLRRNKIGNLAILLLFLIICLIFVHFFSVAHPYLLADNRHYTFYIWRKVIQVHWSMKYLLVPVYIYSWFSIITVLGKAQKRVWVLLFCLANAAVLIPAPLIEFRYYTIPFYFLILNSQIEDGIKWMVIGIIYLFINIITLLMFLCRPFHWDHEPGIQRFIW